MRFPTMWYYMCDQQRLRAECAYAQFGQNLCLSLEYSMTLRTLRLLTIHRLKFLSLKRGCTDSSESNATLSEITCRGSYQTFRAKKVNNKTRSYPRSAWH